MSIESFKAHHPKLAATFALAAGVGGYLAGMGTIAAMLHAASLSPDGSSAHAATAIGTALGGGGAIVGAGIWLMERLKP